MPKISIVLPTYNGSEYIKKSIESIINQTYKDWELIIVNDCSTDNTKDIISEYVKKDDRISVIDNKSNMKLPNSLNIGFKAAKGKYFTWTSDDNYYLPEALETMSSFLDKKLNSIMVCTTYTILDMDDGKTIILKYDPYYIYCGNTVGACFMYRREILETVGEYDPDLFGVEDYDYWLRILIRYGKIDFIDKNLYVYRIHKKSLSSTRKEMINHQLGRLRSKYLPFLIDNIRYDSEYIDDFIFEISCHNSDISLYRLDGFGNSKMKYIIYGAGRVAKRVASVIGIQNILVDFVTNYDGGCVMDGVDIREYSSSDAKYFLETNGSIYTAIIIAVKPSSNADREIMGILDKDNIPYKHFDDLRKEITKKKIESRPDYISIYDRAIGWIRRNNIDGDCIINSSTLHKGYPEVTGYYIPTLLFWGYRDLASSFGKWLCDIQKPDGSWYDTEDEEPYVFDSAQILKGLIAIRKSITETGLKFAYDLDDLDSIIVNGCDWILSNMLPDGRLTTPSTKAWGDGRMCSELIHLYCIKPLIDAAEIYGRNDYKQQADKILNYYLSNYYYEIVDFNLLSHFWSYVIEALIDLGRKDIACEAMRTSQKLQNEIGFVPAYKNVHWCCSTGLFQQAVIWYKLGNIENGNKAFKYACRLQNKSGGWYGSYINPNYPDEKCDYMPDSEISWAVKYFLDALHYKNVAQFDIQAQNFIGYYEETDGRYQTVKNEVLRIKPASGTARILDAGCGKGAYIKNLVNDIPNAQYYGIDISKEVMEFIDDNNIITRQGSLTSIPFYDNTFDMTYTCEALEHAIDIRSAIREMSRVTKSGGTILIIDKNKDHLGDMDIEDWEQWFDETELSDILKCYCTEVREEKNVSYLRSSDGLFDAWIGIVK